MNSIVSKGVLALCAIGMQAGSLAAEIEESPLPQKFSDLERLNQELIAVTQTCADATVGLVGGGAGSGVIVSEDGLVLTAAHVVNAMPGELTVILPDGTRLPAEVLGGEYTRDAAMVRITKKGEYPHVDLAESDDYSFNQWCLALGHPGGFDVKRTPPVRLGRILSVGDFIETDCAVVSGDSGGPLFNIKGQLIGINANIGASLIDNSHVPISVFHDHWEEMLAGKKIGERPSSRRDRPAVSFRVLTEEDLVKIESVAPGSPAAKAGVRKGDVVTAFDGEKVTSQEKLLELMRGLGIGEKFVLTVDRNGESKDLNVRTVSLNRFLKQRDAEATKQPNNPKEPNKNKEQEQTAALDLFLDDYINGGAGKKQLKLTEEQLKKFGGMDRVLARIAERTGSNARVRAPQEDTTPGPPSALELFEETMRTGKVLELSPAQLGELGGNKGLARRVRERMAKLSKEERALVGEKGPRIRLVDPFYYALIATVRPITAQAHPSVAEILVDDSPVSLATVITSDGWLLTSDENITKNEFTVRIAGKSYPGKRMESFPDRNLALLRVQANDLSPIVWSPTASFDLGQLLFTPSHTGEPMGIGVVSVLPRPLKGMGLLGLRSGLIDGKLTVDSLVKEGAAEKGGILPGDHLLTLNGKPAGDPRNFARRIQGFSGGDEITIELEREGVKKTLQFPLGSRPAGSHSAAFIKMNEMSGPLSKKVSGYPLVLQHDMPLSPEQCGGPILNLQGQCLGINVARAGRVKTYALPLEELAPFLQKVAPTKKDDLDEDDIQAVRDLIDEVQENLSDLQERLELLEAR
ncbi:trypsin-like peptidase domain-containing protein [Roseibacillus persicicus]|uniref:PDZ domain-containing protein n=1 Tax=Roseibacillus persicicus TaxID=454148 RepID=A0A918TN00_9BACT|nr:trypsin-like peptidase domain-containing protein [Roseibacillus persicicus]GHC52011.1 hypothetical protein GCM10007100_17880 [Roseibacillus persicicus]